MTASGLHISLQPLGSAWFSRCRQVRATGPTTAFQTPLPAFPLKEQLRPQRQQPGRTGQWSAASGEGITGQQSLASHLGQLLF